ncbi:hypothetical protein Tco_0406925 [Tanacetum coccineum]
MCYRALYLPRILPPTVTLPVKVDYFWEISFFLKILLEDKPSEAKKSEIDPLIREPSDTFLMGDKEIKFNPLKGIDDPVPIPRNEESDESDTETIIDEVQIHSS